MEPLKFGENVIVKIITFIFVCHDSYEKNDFFTENVDALTCLILFELATDVGENSSFANCDVPPGDLKAE